MTALRMISLPIDLREFRRLQALRDHGPDEGRALHHFLSEAFGKSLLQPFRLMVAPGKRLATLYAYTAASEAMLRDNLDCAAPELLGALQTTHLALRDMPETFRHGRRLAFDVRVRPVRRLLRPLEGWSREEHRQTRLGKAPKGAFQKGSEVDAFLIARLRTYPDGLPEAEDDAVSREDVYRSWLGERLGDAASLAEGRTRMVHFAREKAKRCGGGLSEGPDVVFHGELTVEKPDAFTRLLASGVGRHRAYGYGMLLLRPAGA